MSLLSVIRKVGVGCSYYQQLSWINDEYSKAKKFLSKNPYPQLTKEQKEEIDDYWSRYGVQWPDYSWYQMYYGVTGIQDPRFMPDVFVGKVIYPYYNRQSYIAGWDDKNLYAKLLDVVQFPQVLCHRMNGRYFDKNWKPISNYGNEFEKICKLIYESTKDDGFILKETTNTNSGKGVKLYRASSFKEVQNVLNERKSNDFIIQKKVKQHGFFNQFCSTSVNIIRIVSWQHDEEVTLFPASMRFGVEGSHTDIVWIDGVEVANVVGIEDSGIIKDRYVSFSGNIQVEKKINNRIVPSWDKIRNIISEGHKRMPFFDIIGWDFTVDENSNPVCIEYNIIWPGTILYQYANGPFAGNSTDEFISFLKGGKNVPRVFRQGRIMKYL